MTQPWPPTPADGGPSIAAGGRPWAVAAARVFDPAISAHLTDHAVVIRGTAIEWIGPREALPHDQPVIESVDCTMIPGLIDAHVHLAWDPWIDDRDEVPDRDRVLDRALRNIGKHLDHGVTTVRDLGAPSGGVLAAAAALEPPGTGSIVCAGRALGAPGGHAAAIARSAAGTEDMRRAVESEIAAGARCIKVMATGGVLGPAESPSTLEVDEAELRAIVAAAHAHGVPVAVHAHATAAIMAAVRSGADSIEHASGLDAPTAAAMAQHGTRMIPTLSPLRLAALDGAGLGFAEYLVGKARAAFTAVQRATSIARRTGVVIVAGTDAGVPGQEHGSLVTELEAIADTGLSAADCLLAATSRAADLLNVADRGRLRVGSRADLVLVRGDPLRDLGCLNRVETVIQSGRVVRQHHGTPRSREADPSAGHAR